MIYDKLYSVAIIILLLLFGFSVKDYGPKARLFPVLMIIPAFIFQVVILVRQIRPKKSAPEPAERSKEELDHQSTYRKTVSAIIWMLALLVMIYLVGYLITIPIFIFLYTKLHGEKWLLSLGLSLGAVAVVYVVFIMALNSTFEEGLLFRLFG